MPSAQSDVFSDKLSEKQKQETFAQLRRLGGMKVTEESGVAYHTNSRQILLPEGLSITKASKMLSKLATSLEETHDFTHTFKYRPWDGAYALQVTLKELFGYSGQGRAIHTMFGSEPPKYIDIEVGIDQTVKVPWGHVDFPQFEGFFMLGQTNDPTYGALFNVVCRAPKKYEGEIEGFWLAVEETLKRQSIYKGKPIIGVGRQTRNGYEQIKFLDVDAVDPAKVAYKQEVFDRLEASVWGPIKTQDVQRRVGLKLNRKTLLYGPYGTGKSLAGGLTARVAVENGWTFIQTKTGDEDLATVLKTAELYAPACVFIEDIDTLIESDPAEMAKLLELFDGVSSKNKEVMVLMTSNHVDALSKGMTRVGRIDATIEIGDLDKDGIKRLIGANFTDANLDDDIDFEQIFEAMEGFEPAFIMGTFNLTKSNAVVRTGSDAFKVTTRDFVLAAETLRPQHDKHTGALDRPVKDTFGATMSELVGKEVAQQLQGHQVNLGNEGELIPLNA